MLSMQQYITSDRIANLIMMTNSTYKGGYLLTEGENDVKFYSNLCNKKQCKVFFLVEKDEVIKTIRLLNQRKAKCALAIVDPDYWLASNFDPNIDNLIFGDVHDIDVTIFLSKALNKFVSECIPARNNDKVESITNELRTFCLKLGHEIGIMRWTNETLSLFFDFKDLPYDRFCDFDKMEVDLKELYKTLIATQHHPPKSEFEIFEEYKRLKQLNKDSRITAQGHDLANLVEFILPNVTKKALGHDSSQRTIKKIPCNKIPMMLRLAYEKKYFAGTVLFKKILDWQVSNPMFPMFVLE